MKAIGNMEVLHLTDELRKLILENPELPLLVGVLDEDAQGYICTDVRASLGEFLDYEQEINECSTYCDRDQFREDLEDYYYCNFEGNDAEFDKYIDDKIAWYNQYWKKCIILNVGI